MQKPGGKHWQYLARRHSYVRRLFDNVAKQRILHTWLVPLDEESHKSSVQKNVFFATDIKYKYRVNLNKNLMIRRQFCRSGTFDLQMPYTKYI